MCTIIVKKKKGIYNIFEHLTDIQYLRSLIIFKTRIIKFIRTHTHIKIYLRYILHTQIDTPPFYSISQLHLVFLVFSNLKTFVLFLI